MTVLEECEHALSDINVGTPSQFLIFHNVLHPLQDIHVALEELVHQGKAEKQKNDVYDQKYFPPCDTHIYGPVIKRYTLWEAIKEIWS